MTISTPTCQRALLVAWAATMLWGASQANGQPAEPKTDMPRSAEEAAARFQTQALRVVRELPRGDQRDGLLDQLKDVQKLAAQRIKFAAAHARVESATRPEERARLIIHGKLDDLQTAGECWDVGYFVGLGSGIEGYLDAKTGQLKLLWIVPEG